MTVRAPILDAAAAALSLLFLGLFLYRFVPAVGPVAAAGLALPLLIPAIVYRTDPVRAYQWLCVLIIPYLGIAIVELVANPTQRLWASVFAVTGLVQFIVASLGTRVSATPAPRS